MNNTKQKICGLTIKNKIWLGVAKILAGHNTRDDTRFAAGQELIRQALAQISAHENSGQLAELNAATDEMDEIARRWIEDRDEQLAFLRARERHQEALAKLAGGI